jgi:hypothetical protein
MRPVGRDGGRPQLLASAALGRGRSLVEGGARVWPVFVVVAAVDAEDVLEVAASEDEDPVEAVGAQRSYPAFGVGVRVRRLDRRADHLDALGAEDLVEGVAELRVAVVDEQPERVLVAELHAQVARLLCDPAPVGIRAGGDVLDPSRRERDEEQHVNPLQESSLDREEVAGKHACRLRAQERAPRRMAPLRGRLKAFFEQHFPHRGRGHGDAQNLEFANDTSVSPVAGSRGRAAGSAHVATTRAAAGPEPGAYTSSGE